MPHPTTGDDRCRHCDLLSGNVLVEQGRLVGVLDFHLNLEAEFFSMKLL